MFGQFFSLPFDEDPQIDLRRNKKKPRKPRRQDSCTLDDLTTRIPRENDSGNREYKLQLLNLPPERLQHLSTQMKFRLAEGQGTAFYMLGFTDDGDPQGLTLQDMQQSLRNLKIMADKIRARLTTLRRVPVSDREVAEIMVNRQDRQSLLIDVKTILLGCGGSGKSTLVSVLTTDRADNGRGLARSQIHRHKHELFSGITSSISHHILGFDSSGNTTNCFHGHMNDHGYIVDNSSKLVTLIDLGGHDTYPKQVVTAMCSQFADYALIVHDATKQFDPTSVAHVQLCAQLGLPMIAVFTKVDVASEEQLRRSREQFDFLVRSLFTLSVQNEQDVVMCSSNMLQKVVPVFYVSCVTKMRLNLLKMLLNLLPIPKSWDETSAAIFHVEKTFARDGTIVCGVMTKGTVNFGQWMFLGPNDAGEYSEVKIQSIHCKDVKVLSVKAGHFCSFLLDDVRPVRPGMVLLDSQSEPLAALEFECELVITDAAKVPRIMKPTYQPCVHVGMIKQSAKVVQDEPVEVSIGEAFRLRLCFLYYPVYIRVGDKLMVKDTFMASVGTITQVNYLNAGE